MSEQLTRAQTRAPQASRLAEVLSKNLGLAIAYATLKKASSPVDSIALGQPVCVGFVVSHEDDLSLYSKALRVLALGESFDAFGLPNDVAIETFNHKRARRTPEIVEGLSKDRAFVVVADRDFLPSGFEAMADAVIDVPLPTPGAVALAIRRRFGIRLSKTEARQIAGYRVSHIDMACRKGRSVERMLAVLRVLNQENAEEQPKTETTRGPTLDDLPGMGEAADWGRQLARDLADYRSGRIAWSDVDRGVLVSGPPGCGKTSFATALAGTCGVPVIIASLARWQAKGYLSDLLKAMRAAFDEAKKAAPAILFVDELDSFGDREQLASTESRHQQYCREVINGFLECLDGAEKRDGVVVVGSTNHPEMIDQAIRRPGRLDKHIVIPSPDREARAAILRLHLKADLDDDALLAAADRTSGWTGARLEQLARSARRTARLERRAVTPEDLMGSLPRIIPLPDDFKRRCAIHEAGHAVVGLALGRQIEAVSVADTLEEGTGAMMAGGVLYREVRFEIRSAQWHRDRIATQLAGIAAEEVLCGSRTDGAGGVEGSDLDDATVSAAALEASLGLGDTLLFLCPSRHDELTAAVRLDPGLRVRVEKVLAAELGRARAIVEERISEVRRLSEELFGRRYMTREEIDLVVAMRPGSRSEEHDPADATTGGF